MPGFFSKYSVPIVGVCVIVLVGILWVVSYARDSSQVNVPPSSPSTTMIDASPTPTKAETQNYITVNMEDASRTAIISMVRFEDPGFVTIQADENGKPGPILGTSPLLPRGVTNFLTFPLSRIVHREILHAVAYLDNGDGVFHPKDDEVLLDDDGKPVITTFDIDE